MVDDIVRDGKALLAREKAKNLIAEAEILSEQDLRGALGMLRGALEIAPDYPDLEDEIFLREDAIEKLDGVMQHIVSQLQNGKTYRAFQLLQELPDNYIILDKTGTVEELAGKVEKVEKLIEDARNLPRSGTSQALPMLEEAYELMPDYPGLEEDIGALKNSQQHYNDYISAVETAVGAGDLDKARDLLDKFKAVYTDDVSIGRLEVAIVNKEKELKKRQALKKTILKAAGAVAGILLLVVAYAVFEVVTFGSAEKEYGELQGYLKAKEYAKVKVTGEEVIKKLAHVSFSSQQKKSELLSRVNDILNSQEVIQGAQGNILVDGAYIPKESMAGAKEAKTIISEAEARMAAGDFVGAVARYEDALKITAKIDAKLAGKINSSVEKAIRNVHVAHIKSIIDKADSLKKKGSYEEALAEFANAKGVASKYGFKNRDSVNLQIEKGVAGIKTLKLDSLIGDGDRLLSDGEYDTAITVYKRALDFARLNKRDNTQTLNKLYGSINRARIYGLLAKGDENFASSRWIDAIRYYNNAVELSVKAGLRKMPILDRAVNNISLAEKRITLDEIKRMELSAGKKFSEEKWQDAYESYKNLLSAVGKSGLTDNDDLDVILKRSNENLAVAEERIFIQSRKEYLLEKYRSIMKKAFGTSTETTFLNPEVILLKADEKTLRFSLSAKSYSKKGGSKGKYSNYEVQYLYDRENDSWHLLDKSSSSQGG